MENEREIVAEETKKEAKRCKQNEMDESEMRKKRTEYEKEKIRGIGKEKIRKVEKGGRKRKEGYKTKVGDIRTEREGVKKKDDGKTGDRKNRREKRRRRKREEDEHGSSMEKGVRRKKRKADETQRDQGTKVEKG
ncbi:hypothetical protein Tco_1227838 [Tanacetum coccineum]